MTDLALPPEFPILVSGEEWADHLSANATELATDVEFVDDYDPPYRATDANGRRVRLIVWNLELLVCHTVHSDFSPDALVLRRYRSKDLASTYHLEHLQERAVRSLEVDSQEHPVRCGPTEWNQLVASLPQQVEHGLGEADVLSNREFHERWMKARLGRRWP